MLVFFLITVVIFTAMGLSYPPNIKTHVSSIMSEDRHTFEDYSLVYSEESERAFVVAHEILVKVKKLK